MTYTASNAPPATPTAFEPASAGTASSTTPYLVMQTTDSNSDTIKYVAYLYSTTANTGGNCSGTLIETGDQTSSGTGWDNGTTAYASGAYATYTLQNTLTRGNGYCWQAKAIDPAGSNTYSSLSTASTFTVSSGPLTAGYETGTNGNSLSTSDTGNSTPFDDFSCSAGDTLAYSNAISKLGSLSAKLTHSNNINSCYWRWTTSLATQNDFYGRVYFYINSLPAGNSILFYGTYSNSVNWSVDVQPTGNIEFDDRFGTTQATSTNTIAAAQWFRLEYHIITGPNSYMTMKLFLSPDSTTPTETVSTPNMGGAIGNYTDGLALGNNGSNPITLYTDGVISGADNWPGPNLAPNSPSLNAPSSGATGVSLTPSFTLSTTDPDSDTLKYRIYLYQSDCSTPVGTSPFAQASSGTGWDNGTTAYISGATATYTYQGTLANNTTYCWKADALDVSGINTYGSASSTRLFTTLTAGGQTNIQGGVDIRGGSTIQ